MQLRCIYSKVSILCFSKQEILRSSNYNKTLKSILFIGLPNIPSDVSVREGRKRRTVIIEWKPGKILTGATVLYLVEERHHAGRHLIESRMGEWTPCIRSAKSIVRHLIKPGRWYQYRVAAVNENGTKGVSGRSLGFIASTGNFVLK